jgi:acetyltransferase
MVAYAGYRRRPLRVVERFPVNRVPVNKIIRVYQEQGVREIGEADAMTVMEAYNFDVPPRALATTPDEAASLAREVGFPLAMKISSPDILHKSDVGGVRVNIHSIEEVRDAFELMMIRIAKRKPEADIRGILLEKMVAGGREVILGMKKDPQFGPVLMFGLGGIFVEVLKDVTFALAPLTEEECYRMIERTRAYRLLAGVRGQEPVDIPAVVRAIQRLSQLVMDFPQIDEVDINPLKVGQVGDGAFVVDARIILGEEARR